MILMSVITCQVFLHNRYFFVDKQIKHWYSKKVVERRTKMKEKELRRSMSVFPIGTVMKLTDLTARQIRYYEEQDLIHPERNEGNRRMYSLNDIDVLLEIKDYLSDGINMAGIKRIYELKQQEQEKKLTEQKRIMTDDDVRRILHAEFLSVSGMNNHGPNQSVDPNRMI